MAEEKRIGIIGVGPRGLYALEQLLEKISNKDLERKFKILVFDGSKYPGAGNVWNLDQPETNWININERALKEIPSRSELKIGRFIIPSFPSYHQWIAKDYDLLSDLTPDSYPNRSKMGRYLSERFESLIKALEDYENFNMYKSNVSEISYDQQVFELKLLDGDYKVCDEVLLAIGHQDTESSKQLKKWNAHNNINDVIQLVSNIYPINDWINNLTIKDRTIGIRGFGLSMFDAIRALTCLQEGNIITENQETIKLKLLNNSNFPKRIVIFSLDGKPMAPKPLNKAIDDWFKPDDAKTAQYTSNIQKFMESGKSDGLLEFIQNEVAQISAEQFLLLEEKAVAHQKDLNTIQILAYDWLKNEDQKNDIFTPISQGVESIISNFINMATGRDKITLDYCIGQVYRHLQPLMYKIFYHPKIEDEIIQKIIEFDEKLKRYAYGPPVESHEQLLAFVKEKLVTLDFVNDPEIELIDDGWKLTSDNNCIIVDTMINCVLDPPKLLEVTSSIITSLLKDNYLEPIHSKLGIDTSQNGLIINKKDKTIPLAVIGRLTKGNVLGVDAILECFNKAADDWSTGILDRS